MKVEGIKLALAKNREHHVQFGLLQDLRSSYEKAEGIISKANSEKAKIKSMYSDALIILNQSIPSRADKAINDLKDYDAPEVIAKFVKLKELAKNKEKEIMPIYNFLK